MIINIRVWKWKNPSLVYIFFLVYVSFLSKLSSLIYNQNKNIVLITSLFRSAFHTILSSSNPPAQRANIDFLLPYVERIPSSYGYRIAPERIFRDILRICSSVAGDNGYSQYCTKFREGDSVLLSVASNREAISSSWN